MKAASAFTGNALGFTSLFALLGWAGTRVIWLGLATLFLSSANAFFHLTHSVTHQVYVPGAVTGVLLYLPLSLLATRFAVRRDEVDARRLLLAFALGTLASLAPFLHVRAALLALG